jgi:hypothetical protein
MGTRSLTRVISKHKDAKGNDKKEILLTMYRQMDGYLEGHGTELAEFLNSRYMVNGLKLGEDNKVFNGIGCLAAQLVSYFKGDDAGGIYIYFNSVKDAWQNYEYHIIIDTDDENSKITLICYEFHSKRKKKLFEGTPQGFINKYVNI